MKKLKDKEKQLLESVAQHHAPWIQRSIKSLRSAGKISPQFENSDFHNTGFNAIIEALSSYNPEKGAFKTHAQKILKHRIMGQVEESMARSGGGGVDSYFLAQARANKNAKPTAPVVETQPNQEPALPSPEVKPKKIP